MLLIGAGLLIRSFLRVLEVDLGFQPGTSYSLGSLPLWLLERAQRRRCKRSFYDRCRYRGSKLYLASFTAGVTKRASVDPRPQLGHLRAKASLTRVTRVQSLVPV